MLVRSFFNLLLVCILRRVIPVHLCSNGVSAFFDHSYPSRLVRHFDVQMIRFICRLGSRKTFEIQKSNDRRRYARRSNLPDRSLRKMIRLSLCFSIKRPCGPSPVNYSPTSNVYASAKKRIKPKNESVKRKKRRSEKNG